MSLCIYYKNRIGLTFNKREHIFPKAIGGIERLDAGVVSDQANEFFANNLEVKTLRMSEIFIGRIVNGYNKKPSKEKQKIEPCLNFCLIERLIQEPWVR